MLVLATEGGQLTGASGRQLAGVCIGFCVLAWMPVPWSMGVYGSHPLGASEKPQMRTLLTWECILRWFQLKSGDDVIAIVCLSSWRSKE